MNCKGNFWIVERASLWRHLTLTQRSLQLNVLMSDWKTYEYVHMVFYHACLMTFFCSKSVLKSNGDINVYYIYDDVFGVCLKLPATLMYVP